MTTEKLESLRGNKVYAPAVRFILTLVAAGVALGNIRVSNFESARGMQTRNKKYANRTVVVIPPGKEAKAESWLSFSEFGQRSIAKAVAQAKGESQEYPRKSGDGPEGIPSAALVAAALKPQGRYTRHLAAAGMLVA